MPLVFTAVNALIQDEIKDKARLVNLVCFLLFRWCRRLMLFLSVPFWFLQSRFPPPNVVFCFVILHKAYDHNTQFKFDFDRFVIYSGGSVVLNALKKGTCFAALLWFPFTKYFRGCRGCDRMVVGFTPTYAIGAHIH